jgi:hypothetical protein
MAHERSHPSTYICIFTRAQRNSSPTPGSGSAPTLYSDSSSCTGGMPLLLRCPQQPPPVAAARGSEPCLCCGWLRPGRLHPSWHRPRSPYLVGAVSMQGVLPLAPGQEEGKPRSRAPHMRSHRYGLESSGCAAVGVGVAAARCGGGRAVGLRPMGYYAGLCLQLRNEDCSDEDLLQRQSNAMLCSTWWLMRRGGGCQDPSFFSPRACTHDVRQAPQQFRLQAQLVGGRLLSTGVYPRRISRGMNLCIP